MPISNKNSSICAVIVTYEPDNSLIRLYNSIKNQVHEIIIFDNNTRNKDSLSILKQLENNDISVIYNKENIGVATALNQCIKLAMKKNYKWILTLDQDSEFLENTYDLILKSYENFKIKENVMILAPISVERVNLKKENKNLPDFKNILWKNVVLNLTSGSLIKTAAFNKVGFFDDKLFIEQVDNDFCYRLKKNNYEIKVAENIPFIQEIGNAKKICGCIVRNHSSKRKYFLSRNVTIMLRRYFSVAPYTTLRYFLGGTIFSWIKVLLFEKEKLKKVSAGIKGFFDGI